MYSRLLKTPDKKSFFLFGPRGTGKTTFVKARFPDAVYLDLLDAELFNDLLASPRRLGDFIPRDRAGFVVVDEIQRIPELLNEVHRLIERERRRFVLTGSSARKLRRGGVNLLAGRALSLRLHPFAAVELGDDFDLARALSFGQLPSVPGEEDPKAYLESYVRTYLEEEIRSEGLTRNLGAFSRFLEAASFSQGAVLNVASVARECGVQRKVVEGYFDILDDLLIAHRLPVFTKRARRRLVAHPKFYFFDVGLYRTLRPKGPLDLPGEIDGAAFETLFLQELRAVNDSLGFGYDLSYWRTSNGAEVDFVLHGERGFFAIEVKRTGRARGADLAGLKAFRRDYPEARAMLVYGGERPMRDGEIEIRPIERTLRELPDLLGGKGA